MSLLSLRDGHLALDLAPDCGGSIARFAFEGKGDILRPATAEALASGKGNNTACYPLVPYSNRIAEGRLTVAGQTIKLAPNWPGQRHPMHGDGWSARWEVTRSDAQSAQLVYEHDAQTGWPYRYRAYQNFTLDDDTLFVSMLLANLERHAVPAGFGLHPFFVRDSDSELTCRTTGVWLTDDEVIPVERVPLPAEWDFSHPRRIDDAVLDHCFDGWDGEARLSWPSRGLTVDVSATEKFRHLVIFTPPGRPFFCVEPVSHANGAIGSTRLMVDDELMGDITFTVRSSSRDATAASR